MKRHDFHFDLPDELIAQHPTKNRTGSRLLTVNGETQKYTDKLFKDIVELINPGDLLVFNNTKVIPARLYGQKLSGGKLEVLIERVTSPTSALAKIRSSKSPKPGVQINLGTDHQSLPSFTALVEARQGELFELNFSEHALDKQLNIYELLEHYGHMPLPPYVQRDDNEQDINRYQTVYAKELGAVAAPTAGLHFDENILDMLKNKGVNFAFVTLHVGAGTYQPVRADNIIDHEMHSEYIQISQETIEQIIDTKKNAKRVIAVGTTSLRCLESAALFSMQDFSMQEITLNDSKQENNFSYQLLKPYTGETDIFIYPGYQFKVIDALMTNFHLSESTLFMLVSALTSLSTMQSAYAHAIKEQYRFFSYGDAMLITGINKLN